VERRCQTGYRAVGARLRLGPIAIQAVRPGVGLPIVPSARLKGSADLWISERSTLNVSREASYGKTKLNNAKEDSALSVMLKHDAAFQRPSSATRKKILELLGLSMFSPRAFDLIQTDVPLPTLTPENVGQHIDAIRLIEVKATKKAIPDENLHGFFFGATQNEYELAARLGERYKFAFVVLAPSQDKPPFFVLLTLDEVEAKTSKRRVQYQVNLRGRPH